jgi:hypothetical protein
VRRRRLPAAALVATLLAGAATASATSLPKPGTPGQVQRLVAASASINTLSPDLASVLAASRYYVPAKYYPVVGAIGTDNCVDLTTCVFGDPSSSTVVVLYGDSHAYMWLPALAPAAVRDHYKLILAWQPGCPIVGLTNYQFVGGDPNVGCAAWRAQIIPEIVALHPALVLLGERTAQVVAEPSGQPYTDAQWRSALVPAIRSLQSSTTRVAIIEDVPFFNENPPQSCLAAYPTAIQQQCAVPYPNPVNPGHQRAERQAAAAASASFIRTVPWFCTTTCSPVIGPWITYYDQGHVAAPYAAFLSVVLGDAVAAILNH